MQDIDSMFAVCNLRGRQINGWNVISKIPSPDMSKGETGGNFSICYFVEKNGEECFMKVLDYRHLYFGHLSSGEMRIDVVNRGTQEFKYEMDLSRRCTEHNLKRVVAFVDGGEIEIPEFIIPTVTYIIYEKAEGNIRQVLDLTRKTLLLDKLNSLSDKLKSLHDITLGVQQLHNIDISHQDIKPSNILYVLGESKLGDLGRALCLDSSVSCPFSLKGFWGDLGYAPPEALFRFYLEDEKLRIYQMDNYMIGSLIVYYICGVSFNTLMNSHLPINMKDMARSGISYSEAKLQLVNAYHSALLDFENDIDIDDIKRPLVQIVEYLCNPDPEKRGHPKNVAKSSRTSNYNLERTISELDLILRKAEIAIRKFK